MKKKRILILVVSYNAEATIKTLLDRIPKSFFNRPELEILISDDSSQDKTSILAENYKKKNKLTNLKIEKNEKNKGYGGNQKKGYNYAIQNLFDIVVMVHGDAQYPPEYISELIEPIKEGKADFVFGSRMSGDPLGGGMPLYKYFGNKFLTGIENFILKTRLSEFHSGFRAYSTSALKDIPFNENSDDFHFDSEIIIQLVIAKKRIGEITIPTHYGDEKCHVNVYKYGLNILKIMGQYLLNKFKIKKYSKFRPIFSHNNKA